MSHENPEISARETFSHNKQKDPKIWWEESFHLNRSIEPILPTFRWMATSWYGPM